MPGGAVKRKIAAVTKPVAVTMKPVRAQRSNEKLVADIKDGTYSVIKVFS